MWSFPGEEMWSFLGPKDHPVNVKYSALLGRIVALIVVVCVFVCVCARQYVRVCVDAERVDISRIVCFNLVLEIVLQ